ncbi:hypothetical protein HK096_007595 [Nowakowskiella sp. JEL0078]|nr:hypothetical protein HK096_007595 [Nowakowskiella sp. JEL0078]
MTLPSKLLFSVSLPRLGRHGIATQKVVDPLPFSSLPHPPESRFLKSSYAYFAKDNGFSRLVQRSKQLHEELGPIYRFRYVPGENYAVSLSDPEAAAQVFRNEGHMPLRPSLPAWLEYRKLRNMVLGPANTNDYDVWKRLRGPLNDTIFKPANAISYIERLQPVADDLTYRVLHKQKISNSEYVDINEDLFMFSFEAVSTVVFGKRLNCLSRDPNIPLGDEESRMVSAVHGFFDSTRRTLTIPAFPNFIRNMYPAWREHIKFSDDLFNIGNKFVKEKLALKTANGPENVDEKFDLLSYLLNREELTHEEASTLAVEVLTAGIDTTSRALQWVLLNVSKSETLQEKLRDEVIGAAGATEPITKSGLAKMPLLKACLKESFRLYPVASPASRTLPQDTNLLGYLIPAGTNIQMQIYSTSRDSEIFENPYKFDPERWLGETRKEGSEKKSFSTLPFGFGPRMCVGRRLAETEIYLAMANLIRVAKLEFDPSLSLPEASTSNLLLAPEGEMRFAFRPWK